MPDLGDQFVSVRDRLRSAGFGNDEINGWLARKHPELGGESPARCLHCGRAAEVHGLVAVMAELNQKGRI